MVNTLLKSINKLAAKSHISHAVVSRLYPLYGYHNIESSKVTDLNSNYMTGICILDSTGLVLLERTSSVKGMPYHKIDAYLSKHDIVKHSSLETIDGVKILSLELDTVYITSISVNDEYPVDILANLQNIRNTLMFYLKKVTVSIINQHFDTIYHVYYT